MKRLLIILCIIPLVTSCPAQETIEDSLLEARLQALQIQWLDTTNCTTHVNRYVTDELIRQRIEIMPTVVPITYNAVVRQYIDNYLCDPKRLSRLKGLSQFYFPIIEESLIRYGLPVELKYITIIESSLNPSLRSPAGAAGLWQFMPIAAKAYHLDVNSLVDERLDTYRGTEAACQLLKDLYAVYGDWSLVIAAYNCGPGTVRKAIARAGGKREFWSIYPYLPTATRVYMPMFTAFAYIMEYSDVHGICPAPIAQPLLTDTVHVSQRITLQQVSQKTGVSLSLLRLLNPQYIQDVIPGNKPYSVCLPVEEVNKWILAQ